MSSWRRWHDFRNVGHHCPSPQRHNRLSSCDVRTQTRTVGVAAFAALHTDRTVSAVLCQNVIQNLHIRLYQQFLYHGTLYNMYNSPHPPFRLLATSRNLFTIVLDLPCDNTTCCGLRSVLLYIYCLPFSPCVYIRSHATVGWEVGIYCTRPLSVFCGDAWVQECYFW